MRKRIMLTSTAGFCIVFLFFTCGRESDSNSTIQPRVESEDSFFEIKNEVLDNGDIIAYSKLFGKLFWEAPETALFWSLIMANKFDAREAKRDVFLVLLCSHTNRGIPFSEIDSVTKELMHDYLYESAIQGDEKAIEHLIYYYPTDTIHFEEN